MQVVVQNPAAFSISQLRRMLAAGFTSPSHRKLVEMVLEHSDQIKDSGFVNLLVSSAPEELVPLIRQLALAPLPIKSESDLPKYSMGVVRGAMIKALDREKSDLLAALRRAEGAGREEHKLAIQRQLMELEDERRSLMG
jgi:DNA primase